MAAKHLASLLAVAKHPASLLAVASQPVVIPDARRRASFNACSTSTATTAASQHVALSQLAVAKLLASQLAVASLAADVATEPAPKRFVPDVKPIDPQTC